MKIVVLSSLAYSLVNFRGRLLKALVDEGHEVVACAPDDDGEVRAALADMGVGFRITPMNRTGMNPFQDLRTIASYISLMRSEKPDVVIGYTQKPIVYGGLAAQLFRKIRFYALMSGLGYVYSSEADGRTALRKITNMVYRAGIRAARIVFVFNADDRQTMLVNGIVGYDQHIVQVPGSGVDIDHFQQQPLPEGPPVFLMVARIMRDKGVYEFARAAEIVKQKHPGAIFRLLGKLEPDNPTGVPEEQCIEWAKSGLIEYLPETRDVRPHLADASIFVLPSYYREGLPRTLLEALAIGRPLLTTDMPGCREPVDIGRNGWLVPPRDSDALAERMIDMIENPDTVATMAENSRALAVERYDVEKVNRMLLECMLLTKGDVADSIAPPYAGAMRPAPVHEHI